MQEIIEGLDALQGSNKLHRDFATGILKGSFSYPFHVVIDTGTRQEFISAKKDRNPLHAKTQAEYLNRELTVGLKVMNRLASVDKQRATAFGFISLAGTGLGVVPPLEPSPQLAAIGILGLNGLARIATTWGNQPVMEDLSRMKPGHSLRHRRSIFSGITPECLIMGAVAINTASFIRAQK